MSEWTVVKFSVFASPDLLMLSEDAADELSSNQCYGYKVCSAIIKGLVHVDLTPLEIGPIVHSPWLTLACEILRLEVSTDLPSSTLATLAKFCMPVYFPSWFQIKSKSKVTDEPKSLYQLYQRIRAFFTFKFETLSLKRSEKCLLCSPRKYFASNFS